MASKSYRQTNGRDIYVYMNFSGNSQPEQTKEVVDNRESNANVADMINMPTTMPRVTENITIQQRNLDMLVSIKKVDDTRMASNLPHIGIEELANSLLIIENTFMNAQVADLCE